MFLSTSVDFVTLGHRCAKVWYTALGRRRIFCVTAVFAHDGIQRESDFPWVLGAELFTKVVLAVG